MKRVNFTIPAVSCPVQSPQLKDYPCIKIATTFQCYDLATMIFCRLRDLPRPIYNHERAFAPVMGEVSA